MFCPKCGVKNLEDVKFCRGCGADIRLVPQALAGSLTELAALEPKVKDEKVSKPDESPTLDKGLENVFSSVAFFLIIMLGFVYFKGFFLVWIWFIIPALGQLGKGIGQLIRAGREPRSLPPASPEVAPHATHTPALTGAATAEIVPPSVTENTTRSLGAARNAH
jgi:hypothetical protein